MKRVLYIYRDMDLGGAQNQIVHLASSLLARAACSVHVVSRGGRLVPELEAIGAAHTQVAFGDRSIISLLAAIPRVRRIIEAQHIDIVHSHAVAQSVVAWLAVRASRHRGRPAIPVITTVHSSWEDKEALGDMNPIVWLAYLLLHLCSSHIIVVSDGFLSNLLHHRIERRKITLIHHGIDLERYSLRCASLTEEQSARSTKPWLLVGTAGRLVQQKRFDLFLEAAARIAAVREDVRFAIVGDGPQYRMLVEQSRRLGIANKVHFAGYHRDLSSILPSFDVFVSTSAWEGLPSCLVEAMALERPVVATNVKGNNEVVLDGKTGVLVEPMPPALALAVIALLEDASKRTRLGAEARRVAVERYSLETMCSRVESLYEQVLSYRA